jgi:hypothetical protein
MGVALDSAVALNHAHIELDSDVQELPFDIDLEQDTASVFLTVTIPKSAAEILVAEVLGMVSRAFAETEGVSTEWMHEVLEEQVRGFEDAGHLKFVWERGLEGKGPCYSEARRESRQANSMAHPQLNRWISSVRN